MHVITVQHVTTHTYNLWWKVVHECEEEPLFQLSSEDVDRLGNNSNLQEVIVPFEQLDILEEIAEGIVLLALYNKHRSKI